MNITEQNILSNQEIYILISIMSNRSKPGDSVRKEKIIENMLSVNLNDFTTNMAILRLLKKQMIAEDEHMLAYLLTDHGEDWLLANEEKLTLLLSEKI